MARTRCAHRFTRTLSTAETGQPDILIQFLETAEQDLSEELRAPPPKARPPSTGRNKRESAVD
jgi:hypothetical protein